MRRGEPAVWARFFLAALAGAAATTAGVTTNVHFLRNLFGNHTISGR
jgi:hypothetical protein